MVWVMCNYILSELAKNLYHATGLKSTPNYARLIKMYSFWRALFHLHLLIDTAWFVMNCFTRCRSLTRSSERRSSGDYDKPVASRSVSSVVRNRSRSPREPDLRGREYSRSGAGEPRGSSREPEPRIREYSRSAVVESSRMSSRDEEPPRTRDYSRSLAVEPPRGASREEESRSREYRRATGEPRVLSDEKDRYYEAVQPSSSSLERSRADRSERVDRERERAVAEREVVERSHRSERTERDYSDRIERDAEPPPRIPRDRGSERGSERESERSRDRGSDRNERDYGERETERQRDRGSEREYVERVERVERDYLDRDGDRHRDRASERDYGERTERERDRSDRERDYAIRSSRHYSSQKHGQM